MSPTYIPITVQRNYLPYKWQPGNAQFSCSLVVLYFSQSLGAWVPLPNTSTTLCHHSLLRHGCWCPMHPFRGVLFKQSCIQNKLHSMYYSTCTVKSPTPPTGVSFKLFNLLCVYVSLRLRVQNAVPAQPCVGKFGISLVLLNFLHCNFRLWFKTP